MNHSEQAICSGRLGELACRRPAAASYPVPLCHQHRVEIALSVIPDVLNQEIAGGIHRSRGRTEWPDEVENPQPVVASELLKGTHPAVVYFIANGSRVKIGYSTNLKGRLSALSLEPRSVRLTLVGDDRLEAQFHRCFAPHRVGGTEWFDFAPEISDYISRCMRLDQQILPLKRLHAASPEVPVDADTEILQDALRVFDVEGEGRLPRRVLAARLDIDPDLMFQRLKACGVSPTKPFRFRGVSSRGYSRADFEKALLASV